MQQSCEMTLKEELTTYGKLFTFELPMNTYPDKRMRTIRVWLPEDYDGQLRFPVLYMHDGQNLFNGTENGNNWCVEREMHALRKEGLGAIIVGVDNASTRMSELCPDMPVSDELYVTCNLPRQKIIPTGHLYSKFITEQLKPLIDKTFLTLQDQQNTAIGGSSMGGLMSLYMILKYPHVYSKAMVFSPNFVTHERKILFNWIESTNFNLLKHSKVFMFHGGVGLEAINWTYVQDIFTAMQKHNMDDTQLALIYDSRQPHYETAWRKYFPQALRYLLNQDNSESKYFK